MQWQLRVECRLQAMTNVCDAKNTVARASSCQNDSRRQIDVKATRIFVRDFGRIHHGAQGRGCVSWSSLSRQLRCRLPRSSRVSPGSRHLRSFELHPGGALSSSVPCAAEIPRAAEIRLRWLSIRGTLSILLRSTVPIVLPIWPGWLPDGNGLLRLSTRVVDRSWPWSWVRLRSHWVGLVAISQ